MKKIILLVLIFLFLAFPSLAWAANLSWSWKSISPIPIKTTDNELNIDAKSIIVFDWETGAVLYEKNPDYTQPIASITKLMTAVILLENYSKKDMITVSYRAANTTGSIMGLVTDEQITVSDIVKGLMVMSANDAAIAVEDQYSQSKIIDQMNQKAKDLELPNTKYFDAIGFDEKNVSSAEELYFLSYYAMQKPEIQQTADTIEEALVSASGQEHILMTTNRLLKNYPDIFGIKTGFTDEAGSCLIAGAEQNGNKIVSVLLGSPNYDQRFTDSRTILDWIYENYKW